MTILRSGGAMMPRVEKWTPQRAAFYAARDLHEVTRTMSEETLCELFPDHRRAADDRMRRKRLRLEAEAEGRILVR